MRSIRLAAALCALVTVAACGKGKEAATADVADSAESAAPAAAPESSPPASTPAAAAEQPGGPAAVQPGDVDKLRAGMQAEVAYHDAAAERMRRAKNGNDSMAVLTDLIGGESERKGAEAAGMALDRYKDLKITVTHALGARQMGESPMMKDMAKADTSEMTPDQRAQFRENMRQMQEAWGEPFKDFPAETQAKLKSEGARIDTLQARLIQAQMTAAGR